MDPMTSIRSAPASGPTMAANPILAGDYPDPSIVRDGADFYLVHSSFTYAPGLLIWHSRNLRDWQPLVHALPRYHADVWAPELVRCGSTWHIYYFTPKGGGNHVISAPDIRGPWSAPVNLDRPGIDPGHIVGTDGTRYLHLSNGTAVTLSPDGLQAVGKPMQVFDAWPIPQDWVIEGVCLEGPKLLWKDGWCHLLVAQGGTAGPATSHMVISARSRHPLGPWEYSPHNPIVHTESASERWWSKGHGTLFDTPDGDWWMVYHAYERDHYHLGRQTLLQRVRWTADGWPVVEGGADQPLTLPELPPTPPSRLPGDFAGDELGWRWRFHRGDGIGRHQVHRGELTLSPAGATEEQPLLVARILMDKDFDLGIEVELHDQVCAGFWLHYHEKCRVGFSVQQGSLRALLPSHTVTNLPAAPRRLRFELSCRDRQAVFRARTLDGELLCRPLGIDISGLHHNQFGGFLSLRPALAAWGDGTAVFRQLRWSTPDAPSTCSPRPESP